MALLTFVLSAWICSCSAGKKVSTGVTPAEFLATMIHNPEFEKYPNGEDFCWNAAYGIDGFIENYKLSKDIQWLDAAVQYYDFLVGKMATDPEGFKGWIGTYEDENKYWQDALVGDALLFGGLLDFSVLVSDHPELKDRYLDKANYYVQLAKTNFFQKWDKRGCWIDDGPYGTYIGFNKFLKPDDLSKWIVDNEVRGVGISHPFNKQFKAGEVFLRLYRVTGEKIYRDRAEKIFFTSKSHFQYFDDHYCWNYFEPLYPGDVDWEHKVTRHGVWTHPWRSGYQAGEVEAIAEAYNCGIVFDEQDIRRIINTNLNVMWNKDTNHPHFINSNGFGADGDTLGLAGFTQAYGESNSVKNEGELWTGLLGFNQQIRDLYALQFKGDTNSTDYLRYKNTVLTNPPTFKRKFSQGDVAVPELVFTESKELNLATVLPHKISGKQKSIIICQSWVAGDLKIELYSRENKKLCSLYDAPIKAGLFIIAWDGKDPGKKENYQGPYKIRWTIGTGFREFPVEIE